MVKFYSFDAIIASQGYHVSKKESWSNAKVDVEVEVGIETTTKSIASDPYSQAIKTKHFTGWKSIGHIPCEISQYIYFIIKQESGRAYKTLKSLKYKTSQIPAGVGEVPLLFKFDCQENG